MVKLLLLMILSSQALFAQLKTEKEHWLGTSLTFEEAFGGNLNRKNCEFKLSSFLGCMAAFNSALSLIQQKTIRLVPDSSSFDPLPGFRTTTDAATYEANLVQIFNDRKTLFSLTRPIDFDQASFLLNTLIKQTGLEAFITGLAVNQYLRYAFDPHTGLTPLSLLEERSQNTVVLKTLGIGYEDVRWKGERKLIISNILRSSAFFSAGVEIGSVIQSVNGKGKVEDMLRELETEKVEVTLENETGLRTLTVERSEQTVPTLESQILTDASGDYGYIRLTTFNDDRACAEMRRVGTDFMKSGVKGLIFDVRRNGGGKIDVARCILNLYLEPGSLDWLEQNLQTGKFDYRIVRGDLQLFKDIPTAILVNGQSASASEALALFLQAYRKAYVVGEKTFGKGTSQRVQTFGANPRLAIALTTAKYFGPHMVSPQLQGVTPDFEVFPRFHQTQPTPFRREADLYPNAIVNPPVTTPEMTDRREEIKSIETCLREKKGREATLRSLSKFKRAVWDYQLGTAKEVIVCAHLLKIPLFTGIDIPKLP